MAKKITNSAEAQSEFERYEAKYIIPYRLIPEMREFLRPFCIPDPNATGSPPEYVITTMQLDSPTGALHYARELEALNRFKLRVRTYGTDGTAPVFLEIKRKVKGVVLKSRVMIPREYWGRAICHRGNPDVREISFRSQHERLAHHEFVRLTELLGARPVVLIRYIRESYLSCAGDYARVTFDRALCYSPVREWAFPKEKQTRWISMDSTMALNRPYPGVILELKTYKNAPLWMVELTERFNLVRIGFCKYSVAVRLESLFQGAEYAQGSENCTYGIMGL